MRKSVILTISFVMGMAFPMNAFGANGDLELVSGSLRFLPGTPIEGRTTRIYATIKNNSTDDLYGTVKFANKTQGATIGSDQPISVFAGKTDDVFIDWSPIPGEQSIQVTIIPWQKGDNSANNSYAVTVNVIGDLDGDGIPDGIDPDTDGDGVANEQDAFSRNPKESKDTDGDGIGDNSDPDIDGDGLTNEKEKSIGTDPLKADTDGDGVPDGKDAFPLDPTESKDSDGDGVPDGKDAFPFDPTEWKDSNRNGIGDNKDPDKDGDGIPNAKDPFPSNIPPVVETSENGGVPLFVSINTGIKLDAGPSYDPDGKITEITWIVDGNPIDTGVVAGASIVNNIAPPGENATTPGAKKPKIYQGISPTITFDTPGVHTIELNVKDNRGEIQKKTWNTYVAASIFTSQGGIASMVIGLALLGVAYYSTRALRRRLSKKQ